MSENERVPLTGASRRAVVGGVVGLGIGGPLLVACGSDSESGSAGGSSDSGGSSGGGTTSTGSIATTSEIPVGSAKIFKAEKVVISQPAAGDFKAFSTICTHQQCPITKLDGDEIECTCHGSRFKVADGSVVDGPANQPLAELKVTVSGEDLSVS